VGKKAPTAKNATGKAAARRCYFSRRSCYIVLKFYLYSIGNATDMNFTVAESFFFCLSRNPCNAYAGVEGVAGWGVGWSIAVIDSCMGLSVRVTLGAKKGTTYGCSEFNLINDRLARREFLRSGRALCVAGFAPRTIPRGGYPFNPLIPEPPRVQCLLACGALSIPPTGGSRGFHPPPNCSSGVVTKARREKRNSYPSCTARQPFPSGSL
jgi:hypothetical protein